MPQPGDPLARLRALLAQAAKEQAENSTRPSAAGDEDTSPNDADDLGYLKRPKDPRDTNFADVKRGTGNPLDFGEASRDPIVTRDTMPSVTSRLKRAFSGQPAKFPELDPYTHKVNEFVTSAETSISAAPFVAARLVPFLGDERRAKLDNISGQILAGGAENLRRGGADPESYAAKAGTLAPLLATGMAVQGGMVAGLGALAEAGIGAGAAEGYAGFANLKRIMDAAGVAGKAARYAAGAIPSAAVVAASTSANDESPVLGRYLGKGKLAAVKEDLLLGAAGHAAISGLSGVRSRLRALDPARPEGRVYEGTVDLPGEMPPEQKRLPKYDPSGPSTPPPELAFLQRAGERGQRRLPARSAGGGEVPPSRSVPRHEDFGGVAPDPEAASGRVLTTPSPAETSANAVSMALTPEEQALQAAGDRGQRLLPSYAPDEGVIPPTGPKGKRVLVTEPPRTMSSEAAPVLTAAEENVKKAQGARFPGGKLRPDFKNVHTDGLLDELDVQVAQRDAATARSEYRMTQPFEGGSGIDRIAVADRRGGGPSRQAKAFKTLEDGDKVITRIEAELERRGVDMAEAMTNRAKSREAGPVEIAKRAWEHEVSNQEVGWSTKEEVDQAKHAYDDAVRQQASTSPQFQKPSPLAELRDQMGLGQEPAHSGSDQSLAAANRQKAIDLYERMIANGMPEEMARKGAASTGAMMERNGHPGWDIPPEYFHAASPLAVLAGGKEAGDEDQSTGRRLGGAAVAGIGLFGLGSGRSGRLLELARNAMKAGKIPERLPDVTRPQFRSPGADPGAGFGKAKPYGPVDTRDYLNFENGRWQELASDPDGKLALEKRTAALVHDRGADFRVPRTFEHVRNDAKILGLDGTQLEQIARKRGLSPEEQLASMSIVKDHMENLVAYSNKLEDPHLPADERNRILQVMGPLEHQTNNLLWHGLTERTAAGRNLSFQRIAAQTTLDKPFWASQAARNLGSDKALDLSHIRKINTFIDQKDRAGLASYVASLKSDHNTSVLEAAYRAGLLTNPATYAKNTAGNIGMAVMEQAKDAPGTVADRAVSGILNAALGENAIKRSRDFAPVASIKAHVQGGKEGADTFWSTLKGDKFIDPTTNKMEHVETRTGNPIIDTYLNMPGRVLGATDDIFKKAALVNSLQQQRRLARMPVAKNITEALAGATPDMVARATSDALIATFQNSSVLGDLGVAAKRALAKKGPVGSFAGTFVLPFAKTPGAVVGATAKYSPLGLAKGSIEIADVIHKGLKLRGTAEGIAAGTHTAEQLTEQLKLVQQLKDKAIDDFGRGFSGTAVMALGVLGATSGLIKVKPSRTDRTARDLGEVTGDPGATIDVGDHNLQIDQFSPVGNLLLLGAYMTKGYQDKNPEARRTELAAKQAAGQTLSGNEAKELASLEAQKAEEGGAMLQSRAMQGAAAALGGLGSTVADSPTMTGAKRVQDLVNDPVGQGTQALKGMATSIIPAGVAALAKLGDGTRRATTGGLGAAFKARLPFLSNTLPAAPDALGTDVSEPLSVRALNMVSPFRVSTDRTAGNTDDARVRKLLETLNVPVTKITQQTKRGETNAQFLDRQKIVGDAIRTRLSGLELGDVTQVKGEERTKLQQLLSRQIQRARSTGSKQAAAKHSTLLFGNDTDPNDLLGR